MADSLSARDGCVRVIDDGVGTRGEVWGEVFEATVRDIDGLEKDELHSCSNHKRQLKCANL